MSLSLLGLFMSSVFSLTAAGFPGKLRSSTASVYEGNVVTKEGAWCWFADPRALHYENVSGTINSTYIGYIDVHGNIKATQHNFLTGKTHEVLIRSYFQPDDHDSPTFLVLPDERVMIFYSRHTDEACFYYRVSKKPGDITSLGAEFKLVTTNNTTYPSPFILSNDPTHIYLCWRGINWHPTIAKLSIPDANDTCNFVWGPYQMVQSTGARPYCKYFSNGKDKIYLTYTTGHPDNEYPNYVYFNYVDINTLQLKDITGTTLSILANGPHQVNKTTYPAAYPNAVVDAPTDQRDWVWQTVVDKDGMPAIAMVQISNDKNTHNYYYAKWTGSSWRKTFLAYGGGKFHQTAGLELCYSGGMAIDDSNPSIVYCAVPVAGASGTVYEIKKFTIGTDGTVTATEQVTANSSLNNVRPYIVTNSSNSPLRLTWMHGNYYDWIVSSSHPMGYATGINCDFALPVDTIRLNDGLLTNEAFDGTVTGTAHTTSGVLVTTKETYATLTAPDAPAFSVSLTPYISAAAYHGTILKIGNLTYGLNDATHKPYLTIGATTYNSSNLLGTSDVWQTAARETSGSWYEPTKLNYFNLTLTYEKGLLTIYRNGLIDQVVDVPGLTLSDVSIGGFTGLVEDCRIYNRALLQGEVKKLTETSLAYTLNSSALANLEIETLQLPAAVYTDVVLPAKTASGNTITWTSNQSQVLSASGLVTLPQTVTPVTLTATIGSLTKPFSVNVFPRDINQNKVLAYQFNATDEYTNNGVRYVTDKSGKGNDATVYGSAQINGTLDMTANTAAGFSTNGYAMAPNGVLNNLRSCTFMAKVKPVSLTNAPRIYDFGSASSNSLLLRANVFSAGFKYNGTTTVLINSATALTTGNEAMVAMTFDAKTKTTKMYLNGVETASAASITYEPYQLTAIGTNDKNYIGRTQWWNSSVASSNVDFVGTIDDFYLFDIALTADEIKQVQSNNNTAVKQTKGKTVAIYPNPAWQNDDISICLNHETVPGQAAKLELVNAEGQTLDVRPVTSNPFKLNGLSHSGIYLIRITSASGVIAAAKLIVR